MPQMWCKKIKDENVPLRFSLLAPPFWKSLAFSHISSGSSLSSSSSSSVEPSSYSKKMSCKPVQTASILHSNQNKLLAYSLYFNEIWYIKEQKTRNKWDEQEHISQDCIFSVCPLSIAITSRSYKYKPQANTYPQATVSWVPATILA